MDWSVFILGFVAGGLIMGLAPLAWFILAVVAEILIATPGNVPGHPEPDLEAQNERLRQENERLRRERDEAHARLRELQGKEHDELKGLVEDALNEGH